MDRQRVIEKLNDTEFKRGDEVYRIVRELGRGGNGVVAEAETDPDTKIELLEKVRTNIKKHSGSFKKRDLFLSRVNDLLKKAKRPQ